MTQLEALKILHRIARKDGPSYQELSASNERDQGLLAYAKRRDQALAVIDKMIIGKIKATE